MFTTAVKSGEICVPNMVEGSKQTTELPSQKIDPNLLAHLTPKHQQVLLQLLDKYADRFSEIPGLQRVQRPSSPSETVEGICRFLYRRFCSALKYLA